MKKKIILSVLVGLFFSHIIIAQETKFEAIFLYNFTRQLGWPNSCQTGDIVIKVLGQSEIVDQINNFAKDKPVSGQNVVAQLATIDNISDCHIIFITEEESDKIQSVLTNIGEKSILVVTEKANLISSGAGVSFVKELDSEGDEVLKYQ